MRRLFLYHPLQGFDPSLVGTKYGSKLHVWDWETRKLRQTLELGADGLIPLEVNMASVVVSLVASAHLLSSIAGGMTTLPRTHTVGKC